MASGRVLEDDSAAGKRAVGANSRSSMPCCAIDAPIRSQSQTTGLGVFAVSSRCTSEAMDDCILTRLTKLEEYSTVVAAGGIAARVSCPIECAAYVKQTSERQVSIHAARETM